MKMTIFKRVIVLGPLLLACILSTPAAAEVMDKEMSIPTVWAWSFLGAILGFFSIRFRWWLGFLTLAIFGFILSGAILEWNDKFVGPAIAAEAGHHYGLYSYFAIAFMIAAHFAGWVLKYLKLRGCRQPNGLNLREPVASADAKKLRR